MVIFRIGRTNYTGKYIFREEYTLWLNEIKANIVNDIFLYLFIRHREEETSKQNIK